MYTLIASGSALVSKVDFNLVAIEIGIDLSNVILTELYMSGFDMT